MITLFLSYALAQAPIETTGAPRPGAAPENAAVVAEVLSREQEILDAVRTADPAAYDKLVRLRQVDRPSYVFHLLKAARSLERARTDPAFVERYQQTRALEAELQRLAAGFGALSPVEQAARRVELERVAGELMDLRQAERRARLEELQVRLADLEAEIAQRELNRDRIVDDYVEKLLREQAEP